MAAPTQAAATAPAGNDRGPLPGLETAEVYAFSGARDRVARRLYGLPGDLVKRPVVILLVQAGERAEIRILERDRGEGTTATVEVWQGSSLDGLPARILRLVVDAAAPSGTTDILPAVREDREFTPLGSTLAPATPRAAFGHAIRTYDGEPSIQATVVAP